jgi:Na+/H+ antiporter NhaA
MALFIAELAFGNTQHLETAKLGIVVASAVAATLAFALGRLILRAKLTDDAATPTEAEASTIV